MKSLVFVMCFPMTGCFYQTVNQFDIERASKVCGGVEKIVEISSSFVGDEVALCKNGENNSLQKVGAE